MSFDHCYMARHLWNSILTTITPTARTLLANWLEINMKSSSVNLTVNFMEPVKRFRLRHGDPSDLCLGNVLFGLFAALKVS